MSWQKDFAQKLALHCEGEIYRTSDGGFFANIMGAEDFNALEAVNLAAEAAKQIRDAEIADYSDFVFDFLTAISASSTVSATDHIAAYRRMNELFTYDDIADLRRGCIHTGGMEASFRRLSIEQQFDLLSEQVEHLSKELSADETSWQLDLTHTLLCWCVKFDSDMATLITEASQENSARNNYVQMEFTQPVWCALLAIARRLRSTP